MSILEKINIMEIGLKSRIDSYWHLVRNQIMPKRKTPRNRQSVPIILRSVEGKLS